MVTRLGPWPGLPVLEKWEQKAPDSAAPARPRVRPGPGALLSPGVTAVAN